MYDYKEIKIIPNYDNTYNVRLLSCKIISNNEEFIGDIEFKRVTNKGVETLKNNKTIDNSEILSEY